MLKATIQVTGLEQAMAQLSRLDAEFQNLEPAIQEAGEYLLNFFMEDVFASQGGDIEEVWQALSEPYATRKAQRYGAGLPILIATGKMRTSYKLYTASDSFVIRNEAQTERGDYYARYHQDGTDKMPQRMMMKFTSEQLQKVRDIVINYLNGRINAL